MAQHSRVQVGVVGCGVVATAYYLPYLRTMDRADLVAVCDCDAERSAACRRLFGARDAYDDYGEMLRHADIEAVFILTGPGTHVDFTLRAVASGKHVLPQKPMATTLQDANAIVTAVRRAGVKVLMEPSANSPLDPAYPPLRALLDAGVLGTPCWFWSFGAVPDQYHPSMGGNPFGEGTFYRKDSGGMLFDDPYAITQLVTLLGPCRSVRGLAKLSAPERWIVPEEAYNRFLAQAQDPENVNYWDVVVNLPRTQRIQMEADAVATIRRWWEQSGRARCPQAERLLITAAVGGSNGSRTRLWKRELQRLADETGLAITVCHYPPGTSKGNKIEHRLFAFLTQNWRGRPLVSYAVILSLIAGTTTSTGLTVQSYLDTDAYPTGVSVSDEEMAALQIERDPFHPDWNYTIRPRSA